MPRSQAKRLRERQGKRKEAVKGAWGRPRRGVATGRRWPVASRRLADACVAAYVGGWGGQQGAALALASRAVWMGGPVPPGGALAAPRRAARPARQGRGATVFCVAFRVVPKSSSSSAPPSPTSSGRESLLHCCAVRLCCLLLHLLLAGALLWLVVLLLLCLFWWCIKDLHLLIVLSFIIPHGSQFYCC